MSTIKCECEERWKELDDFPNYKISSKGNVYSKIVKRNLKHDIDKREGKEYHRITLCKNGIIERFQVSVLVGKFFIPNSENKPTVDHINGDKDNNCVCNLRWANRDEQQWNQKLQKNNTSGHRNIRKSQNKWRLTICGINLGSYDCVEMAIDIRDWYYRIILERECVENH